MEMLQLTAGPARAARGSLVVSTAKLWSPLVTN